MLLLSGDDMGRKRPLRDRIADCDCGQQHCDCIDRRPEGQGLEYPGQQDERGLGWKEEEHPVVEEPEVVDQGNVEYGAVHRSGDEVLVDAREPGDRDEPQEDEEDRGQDHA